MVETITKIPEPDFFLDFGGIPLLNHHLGWPTGGKGRYNVPIAIQVDVFPKYYQELVVS